MEDSFTLNELQYFAGHKIHIRHFLALCLLSNWTCFITPSAKLSSAPEAGTLLPRAQLDFLGAHADKSGTLLLCPQQYRCELEDLVFLTAKGLLSNSLLLECLSSGFSCVLPVPFLC